MPHFYRVQKKIKLHILLIFVIVISIASVSSFIFISTYIQKKRLRSVYDYISGGDYDNASFVFISLYNKYPLDANVLKSGIDLYYDILLRNTDNTTVVKLAGENITSYTKQLLLIHPNIEKKWLLYQRLGASLKELGITYCYDAYDAYKSALSYGDKRTSTLVEMASVCYKIGRYGEAVTYLEKAVEEDTKDNNRTLPDKNMSFELALAYEANKDYNKSIEQLNILSKDIKSDDIFLSKVYNKLGDLYFRQGLYTDSEINYKKALNIDEKNPKIYYNVGVLYRTLNRRREALVMFREALKIDRTYKEAQEALRRF